jgi:tRNA threonylcarbamoyladenosine biosynthesis protein TsaE
MQQTYSSVGLADLPLVASAIINLTETHKIVAFYGQMGAGKTTLIKQICLQLGVIQDVSSPTFALVNEYETRNQNTLYHFDFYRIKNIEEVYDIGYEDYFYSSNLCLMEWPENIEPLLQNEKTIKVHIKPKGEGNREVVIEY